MSEENAKKWHWWHWTLVPFAPVILIIVFSFFIVLILAAIFTNIVCFATGTETPDWACIDED